MENLKFYDNDSNKFITEEEIRKLDFENNVGDLNGITIGLVSYKDIDIKNVCKCIENSINADIKYVIDDLNKCWGCNIDIIDEKILKLEEIKEMDYNITVSPTDYWKNVLLGTIINFIECGKDIKITKKQIDNIIEDLFNDDKLWEEIDFALIDAINENSLGEKI